MPQLASGRVICCTMPPANLPLSPLGRPWRQGQHRNMLCLRLSSEVIIIILLKSHRYVSSFHDPTATPSSTDLSVRKAYSRKREDIFLVMPSVVAQNATPFLRALSFLFYAQWSVCTIFTLTTVPISALYKRLSVLLTSPIGDAFRAQLSPLKRVCVARGGILS